MIIIKKIVYIFQFDKLGKIFNLYKNFASLRKISRFRLGRKNSVLVFYTPVLHGQRSVAESGPTPIPWHRGTWSIAQGFVFGLWTCIQIECTCCQLFPTQFCLNGMSSFIYKYPIIKSTLDNKKDPVGSPKIELCF